MFHTVYLFTFYYLLILLSINISRHQEVGISIRYDRDCKWRECYGVLQDSTTVAKTERRIITIYSSASILVTFPAAWTPCSCKLSL